MPIVVLLPLAQQYQGPGGGSESKGKVTWSPRGNKRPVLDPQQSGTIEHTTLLITVTQYLGHPFLPTPNGDDSCSDS